MKFLKTSLFLALIITSGLGLTTAGFSSQDKIVAIINTDVITEKDLGDFINFMRVQLSGEYKGRELETKIQAMKLDLLDKLIEDKIILQEAKRNKIRIDESRVKARIDEIRRRYDTDRDFQEALGRQGLVQADIENKIREQLLMYTIIDIKIRSRVVISPAEVTDFYQQNMEKFKLPEERGFESVNVDDESLAWEIYNNLRAGMDFSEMADKYSLNINKLSNAGRGTLRDEIEKEISRMKTGGVSPPIKIDESYYILRLTEIKPPRQQTLGEVQDEIYNLLFNAKTEEELAMWLDQLKKQSYVKIF